MNTTIYGQNNMITKIINDYNFHERQKFAPYHIDIMGEDEIVVVGGYAYHATIPRTMFNYCCMKLIMTTIGTTREELQLFEGQFYETREKSYSQ